MSEAPAVVSDNQIKSKTQRLVPPEPKFWKRYSPHHEFPWSALISVAIYLVCGLLIFALVRLALKDSDDMKPPPVYTAEVEPAGGGGNPAGVGTQNPGDLPLPKEAVKDPANQTTADVATPKSPNLERIEPAKPEVPVVTDGGERSISESSEEAIQALRKAEVAATERLKNALGKPPGHGKGGSGSGGGTGSGKGVAEGPGSGSIRQDRLNRWSVNIKYEGRATLREDTRSYLELLKILGAVLAIPHPDGTYLVVRDLTAVPFRAERQTLEQLESIDRIFFKDDKPTFLSGLAHELGLKERPNVCFAFFPEAFEKELLDKERRHRGRSETEIEHTWFQVTQMGPKGYLLRVIDQKP